MDDGLTKKQREVIACARDLLVGSGVSEDDLFFPDAPPLETESNTGYWVKVEVFVPETGP